MTERDILTDVGVKKSALRPTIAVLFDFDLAKLQKTSSKRAACGGLLN